MAEQAPRKRPLPITILCWCMFVLYPVAVFFVLSRGYEGVAGWFVPFVLASQLVALISSVGFWKMRRWALFLYAAFFPISQIAIWFAGLWAPNTLLPLGIILLVAVYYRRLR